MVNSKMKIYIFLLLWYALISVNKEKKEILVILDPLNVPY